MKKNIIRKCLKKGSPEKMGSDQTSYFSYRINRSDLVEVERSYAEAFDKRRNERNAKEREAEKNFQDLIITY